MHISNAYTGSQNVADLTGFLCLPPLKNSSEQPQHAKFVEEINREGVYIHKLSTDLNSLSGQLKKLKENRIPTPATFVGVGIHRTYNHWRWKNTSGLVFSPESISLLSYKGDIASLRIPDGKTLSDFTSGSKHEQYEAYSRYLSKTFNSLKETITAFNNRKPKKLTLIENVDFAKEKYRELEVRSNFAFSKKEIVFENQTHDIASKYIICRILKNTGRLAHQWTRADLLTELTARCEKDEHLAEILKHAIIKIRLFHDDAAQHLYLERGLEEPEKIGHYIEQTSKTGAQTPNEHLLMPTLEDIVGICVNFESVAGVDQAIEINRNLRAEQKDHGIGERNNPALLYQISMKRGKSLTRAGWSHHIVPWSSAGLKEFARTGKVRGIDGGTFTPNHFKAINLLAEIGAVVAFETNKNLHGCHAPQNFISDLSTVKENDENLLHIALKAKCSTEIVNFFYFWKVDAFSERDQNGDTALEIAEREKHPSLEFLKLANGWSNQPAKIIENRNCYIAEQLKKIKKERLSLDLRNGNIETGETDYIQELRTYRVTNGKIRFGGSDDFVHQGVQLYDPETEDMNFVLGSRSFKDNFNAFGVWKPRANHSRPDPALILGLKYHAPINVLPTQKSSETIVLVSNAGVIDHQTQISIEDETHQISNISIESGYMKDDLRDVFDRNSCNYFKVNFTVPSTQLDFLRKSINTGELPSLNFRAMSVCKELPGRERDIIFNNYLISSICWLRSWKNQIASFTPQERKYMVDHSNGSYTDIEHDLVEQIQLLKGQIRGKRMGSVVVLAMRDHYGKSLLHEITEEISRTDDACDADISFSLGALLEDRRAASGPDLELARQMYERADRHGFGRATYAMVRFHNEGIGGLPKNPDKATACMQRAAYLGVTEAKTFLRNEAEQEAAALAVQVELETLELEVAEARKAARGRWERFTHKVDKLFRSKPAI